MQRPRTTARNYSRHLIFANPLGAGQRLSLLERRTSETLCGLPRARKVHAPLQSAGEGGITKCPPNKHVKLAHSTKTLVTSLAPARSLHFFARRNQHTRQQRKATAHQKKQVTNTSLGAEDTASKKTLQHRVQSSHGEKKKRQSEHQTTGASGVNGRRTAARKYGRRTIIRVVKQREGTTRQGNAKRRDSHPSNTSTHPQAMGNVMSLLGHATLQTAPQYVNAPPVTATTLAHPFLLENLDVRRGDQQPTKKQRDWPLTTVRREEPRTNELQCQTLVKRTPLHTALRRRRGKGRGRGKGKGMGKNRHQEKFAMKASMLKTSVRAEQLPRPQRKSE